MNLAVFRNITLATRTAACGVILICLSICVTIGLSYQSARNSILEIAQADLATNMRLLKALYAAQGQPRLEDGALYFGDKPARGDFAVVDQVKAISGGTATIFEGDLRIATNVTRPDGRRAVGTRLAQGPAHEAVLGRKTTYSGTVDILGQTYLAIYEPIIEPASGKAIGVYYVGVKRDEFLDGLSPMLVSMVASGLVLCLLSAVTLFYIVRRLLNPLGTLAQIARRLAEGDLNQPIPERTNADEIANMSQAVAVLRDSAIERRRLEQEAERQSREIEKERELTEAERVALAERQRQQAQELEDIVGLLAEGLENLANGDLTHRIFANMPPAYERLRDNFNSTVDRLSGAMLTIKSMADDVGHTASEISKGASVLAQRTEEQASAIAETTATTDRINAQVQQTAASSNSLQTIADEAIRAATSGDAIAGDAADAMARIERASSRISDITRLIDDIAFQTNLLALNAAVEAARAGEAGKGFAVVAHEVRILAQRSGQAAKDIAALIGESNGEVEDGARLVRSARDALGQILAANQSLAGVVGAITTAAAEQANGISEVDKAVSYIDDMTQQNAALSEESAAAAKLLAQRVEQLGSLIAGFRTNADGRERAGRKPAAIPRAA